MASGKKNVSYRKHMKLKSSEPYWLVKNGILHSYPSLKEDTGTDILIVGGGITGSLIAHQCLKDGYKTLLVDRREVANGSTSASTSMLQYEIDISLHQLIEMIGEKGAVASYRACFDAIDRLGKIVKKVRSDCGFRHKDSLYFAAYKKDVPSLKKEFEARKKHGFPVKWLEAETIKKRYGLAHSFGGILSAQGGSMDTYRFTHDLLAWNHKKGLRIFDKTNLEQVTHSEEGVTAVTEYGNTIKAKKIIYCTGYESTELIKEKFVDLLSTYAIVGEQAEHPQKKLKDTIFWNTAKPYLYLRTTDDNRLLIGGEDEEFADTTKRDALLNDKAEKLDKQLKKLLPEQDFRSDFAWAGTFGETKDGLPYMGAHPDFPSALFVLAFGGNGITFSVVGMEMVAAMLKNKRHPLAEFFRFKR